CAGGVRPDRLAAGRIGGVRVLIADDHGIVRSGIRLLLERQPDLEVVAEAADGAEARDLAIRERPDLAILDVKMPNLTGLQATRAVERGEPFLSPEAQRTLIKDVLERGSSGEEELTPREEEIVKLVAEANTTKQIAGLLHLSEKTVE